MPLADIAAELAGGILRFLAQLFLDVVLEVLVKGPGYMICRIFSKHTDREGPMVVIVGLLFWAAVIAACYAGYSRFATSGA